MRRMPRNYTIPLLDTVFAPVTRPEVATLAGRGT